MKKTPKHLDKIVAFYRANRRMPSHAEIARAAGLRSKGTTYKLVNRLVEQGFVERDENGQAAAGAALQRRAASSARSRPAGPPPPRRSCWTP